MIGKGKIGTSFIKWTSTLQTLGLSVNTQFGRRQFQLISTPPTPLFTACVYGLISIIDCLIPWGIWDSKQVNLCGETCLTIAVEYGGLEVVQKLLSMKCDSNDLDHCKRTPLNIAARKGISKLCDVYCSPVLMCTLLNLLGVQRCMKLQDRT